MPTTLTPDICVIGAGSGGLSVAAAAAAFGVPVVLIEKGEMGGDCLNYGCVPSKALIAASKHAHAVREARAFGIEAGEPVIDFQKVHDHVHGVIAAIAPHDSQERFEGLGVTVIRAPGRFTDAATVVAGDTTIKARRFVIATGSSAAIPPIPGLADVPFLTNESVFDLTRRPDHLIVIGGGPIGLELAQAHRRLGAKVTVLEAFGVFGKDDPDLAKVARAGVEADGVVLREGAKVTAVARAPRATGEGGDGEGIAVTIEVGGATETITGSHLLVAAGRKANVEGLGLEAAGITHERRGITVDAGLRTSNRKVYAIGDVAGGLQFTHVAGYHAGLVIRSILFRLPVKENRDILPWVTYTDPELGQVGLTEKAARERFGDTIKVLTFPYAGNDRAQAERATKGLIKVVTDKRGKILGCGVVGKNAGDILNMWAYAIANGQSVRSFAGYVSPYPTLPEIGKRAAVAFYAPSAANPWVRRVIGWLRRLG
jgi:pyruvate/2-oxoglutarate dehydrogenase complex dihydrolipoamide dehydrogenase (E3) component